MPEETRSIDPESFKDLLQHWRKNQVLTQKELAERANMNPGDISRYESGTHQPTYQVMVRIVNALGISLAQFFSRASTSIWIAQDWAADARMRRGWALEVLTEWTQDVLGLTPLDIPSEELGGFLKGLIAQQPEEWATFEPPQEY